MDAGGLRGKRDALSESAALEKAYEDHEAKLKKILDRICVPEGCSGAAFAVHGRIVGADVFDKPATLAKLWPKLIRVCRCSTRRGRQAGDRLVVDDQPVHIEIFAEPAAL